MTAVTGQAAAAAPELIHHALVYGSDEAFLSATTGFCRDGLAGGDRVLAVTTPANIGLLEDALGPAAAGVEFVAADDWYGAPGRTLAAYGRYVDAHKVRHRRVRIIGEPVWHGRSPAEEAEWTRYESVINAAFAGSPAWIVCPYDERTLPERIVADARRTHPKLLTGSAEHDSHAYTDPAAFAHASDHLPLPPPAGAGEEIRFDADLGRMRQRVAARAAALGLSAGQIDRLLLAVNEVAANAVQHGGGHGRILLWADAAGIGCDVADPGRLSTPFPGYLPPDPLADRGHGLWVVRQLCELLEIRTGRNGTQVRLHLARG
ncbi:anti-sigma factor RsbA family regulatory protein [Planomonospora venezuelensis]|uniref:Anti-sigma regulatory factor (Ser/Thr protein kinase) n=1 Tax=Planomonospora venezuelensis TaxID=1999 RepID=A0A841CXP7_PLAVE|nr:anti-sigma factor RsbA family regulatory protein [Planomonospora venezuelensis]MBB5962079.1 anti-sigma regulatory factor (Ser/Thr protein kinase) [Planomonospora venezuelensis]GIN00180.1 anti-sigma regulatory factor [Planomonospora venezuelensis]